MMGWLTADALLVLGLVGFLGVFDPQIVVWPLLALPLLEASLVLRARAQLAAWAGLGAVFPVT